jgi:hypothetical protein
MLFSRRARVNGPMFLAGWALALAVVSGVGYFVSDASDAATSSSTSDTISWGKIVFGALFLLLESGRRLFRLGGVQILNGSSERTLAQASVNLRVPV